MLKHVRYSVTILIVALLAACQTVPPQPAFSAAQVAALESAGFQRNDGNYTLGLNNRVLFGFDSSTLKPDTLVSLGELAANLSRVGIGGARVEGHADAQGEAEYNRALSERRAIAVKDALVAGGLDDARMRTFGAGEDDPIASNDTEEGRSQNRRVVILVTPQDAMGL